MLYTNYLCDVATSSAHLQWQQIMYGVAVMAGATFSILAMGLSMHIATGMQLMCQKLVSQEPEAAFLGHCHDFVTQYQVRVMRGRGHALL